MKTSFQAQDVKRTGLVRVLESDDAANETNAGDISEADTARIDRELGINKAQSLAEANDRRAMSIQMGKQDELSRICMGE